MFLLFSLIVLFSFNNSSAMVPEEEPEKSTIKSSDLFQETPAGFIQRIARGEITDVSDNSRSRAQGLCDLQFPEVETRTFLHDFAKKKPNVYCLLLHPDVWKSADPEERAVATFGYWTTLFANKRTEKAFEGLTEEQQRSLKGLFIERVEAQIVQGRAEYKGYFCDNNAFKQTVSEAIAAGQYAPKQTGNKKNKKFHLYQATIDNPALKKNDWGKWVISLAAQQWHNVAQTSIHDECAYRYIDTALTNGLSEQARDAGYALVEKILNGKQKNNKKNIASFIDSVGFDAVIKQAEKTENVRAALLVSQVQLEHPEVLARSGKLAGSVSKNLEHVVRKGSSEMARSAIKMVFDSAESKSLSLGLLTLFLEGRLQESPDDPLCAKSVRRSELNADEKTFYNQMLDAIQKLADQPMRTNSDVRDAQIFIYLHRFAPKLSTLTPQERQKAVEYLRNNIERKNLTALAYAGYFSEIAPNPGSRVAYAARVYEVLTPHQSAGSKKAAPVYCQPVVTLLKEIFGDVKEMENPLFFEGFNDDVITHLMSFYKMLNSKEEENLKVTLFIAMDYWLLKKRPMEEHEQIRTLVNALAEQAKTEGWAAFALSYHYFLQARKNNLLHPELALQQALWSHEHMQSAMQRKFNGTILQLFPLYEIEQVLGLLYCSNGNMVQSYRYLNDAVQRSGSSRAKFNLAALVIGHTIEGNLTFSRDQFDKAIEDCMTLGDESFVEEHSTAVHSPVQELKKLYKNRDSLAPERALTDEQIQRIEVAIVPESEKKDVINLNRAQEFLKKGDYLEYLKILEPYAGRNPCIAADLSHIYMCGLGPISVSKLDALLHLRLVFLQKGSAHYLKALNKIKETFESLTDPERYNFLREIFQVKRDLKDTYIEPPILLMLRDLEKNTLQKDQAAKKLLFDSGLAGVINDTIEHLYDLPFLCHYASLSLRRVVDSKDHLKESERELLVTPVRKLAEIVFDHVIGKAPGIALPHYAIKEMINTLEGMGLEIDNNCKFLYACFLISFVKQVNEGAAVNQARMQRAFDLLNSIKEQYCPAKFILYVMHCRPEEYVGLQTLLKPVDRRTVAQQLLDQLCAADYPDALQERAILSMTGLNPDFQRAHTDLKRLKETSPKNSFYLAQLYFEHPELNNNNFQETFTLLENCAVVDPTLVPLTMVRKLVTIFNDYERLKGHFPKVCEEFSQQLCENLLAPHMVAVLDCVDKNQVLDKLAALKELPINVAMARSVSIGCLKMELATHTVQEIQKAGAKIVKRKQDTINELLKHAIISLELATRLDTRCANHWIYFILAKIKLCKAHLNTEQPKFSELQELLVRGIAAARNKKIIHRVDDCYDRIMHEAVRAFSKTEHALDAVQMKKAFDRSWNYQP